MTEVAKPVLDRTSMEALAPKHLVDLLELSIRGERASSGNMVKLVELMKQADTTIKELRDKVSVLEAENATLKRSIGINP